MGACENEAGDDMAGCESAGCDKAEAQSGEAGTVDCPCCTWNRSCVGRYGLTIAVLTMIFWRFNVGWALCCAWLGMELHYGWHSRNERAISTGA